jgi:hypothetical protein
MNPQHADQDKVPPVELKVDSNKILFDPDHGLTNLDCNRSP